MKIELLKNLRIYKSDRSFIDGKIGESFEIDDANAKSLVRSGYAKFPIEKVEIKIEEKKFEEVLENKAIERSAENKSFSKPISKKKK